MKSNFIKLGALLLFVVLMMPSCRKSETQTEFNNAASFDYKVVHSWNELFLNIDKDALGFRPGPGPRALAYMSIAAYEVCVPGMPKYNSLKNLPNFQGSNIPELTGSKDLHYPSAVNAAYAFLMSKMFEKVSFFQSGTGSHIANNAEAQQMIENLRLSLENEYKSQINNTKYINSKAWGEDVARAIWEWSTTDKIGHEAYLNPLNNDPTKTPYHNWKEKAWMHPEIEFQVNGRQLMTTRMVECFHFGARFAPCH